MARWSRASCRAELILAGGDPISLPIDWQLVSLGGEQFLHHIVVDFIEECAQICYSDRAFIAAPEAMVKQHSIKDKMVRSITLRKGEVVLRADFESMGSQSQVSRALRELIKDGKIVRLGYGVYAKARPSSLSGKPVPRVPLEELAEEALQKLGVKPRLGAAQAAYAEGRTTQIPYKTTFNTGQRRMSRRLTVGKRTVNYENDYNSRL